MTAQPQQAIFNPALLSNEKRARLDSLLDQLDIAATERGLFTDAGKIEALKEWLTSLPENRPATDHLAFFQAIPKSRWNAFFAEVEQEFILNHKSPELFVQLKALGTYEQMQALAYASSEWQRFTDATQARKHWKKLNNLYTKILTEFPDILFSQDDAQTILALGGVFAKEYPNLKASWDRATSAKKAEKTKELFEKALPADDVNSMHVATVSLKAAAAAFMPSVNADTMICGGMFYDSTSPGFPMYLFTHEYIHRRQTRLMDRLVKGQLTKGSAEYYQARLFRANFKGGYLSPMATKGKIAMIAQLHDYYNQPVERHANDNASYAHYFGQTGSDLTWKMQEKLGHVFSAAARPLDATSYGVRRVVSAVTSIGRRKPKGP